MNPSRQQPGSPPCQRSDRGQGGGQHHRHNGQHEDEFEVEGKPEVQVGELTRVGQFLDNEGPA